MGKTLPVSVNAGTATGSLVSLALAANAAIDTIQSQTMDDALTAYYATSAYGDAVTWLTTNFPTS